MMSKQENINFMESLYEAVKKNLSLSGKDWENMVNQMSRHPIVKQMTGYPNKEDVAKAKTVAIQALA